MKNFKCMCMVSAVALLASCSYFDTEETIEVTSEGLEMEEPAPVIDENSVERIIYRQTEGAVEVYNLDLTPEDAADVFAPAEELEGTSADALVINPGVEIYPIDIPMQKTLKP